MGVLDHTAEQEGFAERVKDNSRAVGFEVTAEATGSTGRAGPGLVAATAKAIGVDRALSLVVGGARSWVLHDPGKVLRDVALTLADGGDALLPVTVIDRQLVLFGTIASPATACRAIQPDTDLARLDTRHRVHARVEDRIRTGKDTGMRTLPCDTFARNQLWLQLVLLGQDLLTFTQLLGFDPGELRSAGPQQLRYKVLHAPARIIRHARQIRLDLLADWPELIRSWPRSTGSGHYPSPPTD